jgi:hypothetical protein
MSERTEFIVGKVVEVGKMQCYPPGPNGNEVVIEIAKDQTVRVQGISNTVTRWLGSNLFSNIVLTFSHPER